MRGWTNNNTVKANRHWQSGKGGLNIMGGLITGKPLYTQAVSYHGLTTDFINYQTYSPTNGYYTRYPSTGQAGSVWISTLTTAEVKAITSGKIGTANYIYWIKGNGAKITFKNTIKDGVKLYAPRFMISTGKFTSDVATTGVQYSINQHDINVEAGLNSVTYTASNGTIVKITGKYEAVNIPTNTGNLQAFPENDVSSLYKEAPTSRDAFLLDEGLTIECTFANDDNFFALNRIYVLTNHYDLGQDMWTYENTYYKGVVDGKYYMKAIKYDTTTGNE